MAKANQISLDIAPETLVAIAKALTDLKNASSFLINLTKKEKKALKIMGDKSQPFVEKALAIGAANPKMVPSFTDIEDAAKDYGGWRDLSQSAIDIASINSQFQDTMAALGSDAFRAALDIYGTIQMATERNVPGAKSLLDELKPFFEKSKSDDGSKPPTA